MGNFQLEYCKLQIGCPLIVFYLTFIYYKERKRFRISDGITLYDILLVEGMFCLLLDGITAYTVNHQELVHPTVNLVLHGLFLTSIDILIFLMLLYMLDATEGLPKDWKKMSLLCAPLLINVLIVVLNLHSLEYRQGEAGFYSMGISVYTCFAMIAIYILLNIVHVFRTL